MRSGGGARMTGQPLVSICMPMYNAASFVGDAIDGILQQTYQTFVLTRDTAGFRNLHVPIGNYVTSTALDRFRGAAALAGAMARLKTVGFQGAMLYPRSMYDAAEGIRNGRLSNPDKHFTYKLLAQ